MQLSLPISSYKHRSTPASSSRLVNCFPEALPQGAKTPVLLTRVPGIASWTTVGDGPIRGMYAAQIGLTTGQFDYLYVVSGSEWYYVDTAKTATLIGNIGTANRIDIDSNTSHVVVVNEPKGFHWDGDTFAEITDDDFVSRGAGDVEFLDDFLLFREPNSGRFFGADLGSVTDFNALQFAITDSAPDNLRGMIAIHRQLITLGIKSGEIWSNTGVAGFPFERNINGTFEEGCLNAATVAEQDNAVYWVADDYTVRRLQGNIPMRVSTHVIEQAISDSTISSLEAFTYEQDGHFFYILSAIEGTWALDITTGEWSERETHLKSNSITRYHAQFDGKELVGDSTSNKIGYFDRNTYTEYGDVQRMEWTYMPVYAQGQRAFHDRFEIVMETGVGLTVGQGSDPKIMLQYSDDGGVTYKSLPDKNIGPLGERFTRAVWHNLGSSRQRVYKAAISDPISVTITDTLLEIKGGRL